MKTILTAFLVTCSLCAGVSTTWAADEGSARAARGMRKPKASSPAAADDKAMTEFRHLTASSPDEPLAKKYSLANSADYLDKASTAWLKQYRCAACHTSYLYLMAGPSMRAEPSSALRKMRDYLEYRVSHWDSGKESEAPGQGSALEPLPTEGETEIVATAATLAFHDAHATHKLHPLTRQALDRIWTLQQANGAWRWNHTNLAPLEYDDYFGAVFAALGVGSAPDAYADTPRARKGLARLRTYLEKTPAPNLHHRLWLLWASMKLDTLMSPADRKQAIKDLLALQQTDGGWSLPSLWEPHGKEAHGAPAKSDGYATGLSIYVMRQAGLPVDDPGIQKGVRWLKTHQRESGRWFTHSINGVATHYITNAGSALCVMALKACEPAPGE